jgi:hypothetical protein
MNRPDQLAAIDRHLRKDNWLLNEALIAELTDHYANATAERMAQGLPFETALWDVHKGFGGRKGLLKMEEEYALSQYQQSTKAFRQVLSSYFKPIRILLTVCLFFGFLWFSKAFPHPGRHEMIAGGVMMLVFIIAIVLSVSLLIQKFRQQNQKAYKCLAGRHIGAMFMGFSFINSMVWIYTIFVPENFRTLYEPHYTALLLTLVTVYAFSTMEYAQRVVRQPKTT